MDKSNYISQFEKKIKKRIIILELVCVFIPIYIVLIYLFGGGDSRIIKSNILTFGSQAILISLFYYIYKIHFYKRLVVDKSKLIQEMEHQNKNNGILLYQKSGGKVWSSLFTICLFVTITCSQFNEIGFIISYLIMIGMIIYKIIAILYYRRCLNICDKQKGDIFNEKNN